MESDEPIKMCNVYRTMKPSRSPIHTHKLAHTFQSIPKYGEAPMVIHTDIAAIFCSVCYSTFQLKKKNGKNKSEAHTGVKSLFECSVPSDAD